MKRVLIIGAGGHAQVVADILLRMHEMGADLTPIGFLDDNPHLFGEWRLGLPILGPLAAIDAVDHDCVVIGIGDNRTRRAIYERLTACGEQFTVACHPTAIVARDAVIGAGTVIAARAVVNAGAHIGMNVILNSGCIIEHHNRIGAHAHIAPGATLGGAVTVSEGALVGIGATVLPQRAVGAWSVVGGGAVVTSAVDDNQVVSGVPARPHLASPHLIPARRRARVGV
ncbi:acetyltransferase [Roseiflexus sp.]|uniref:acetyltransferase n=1 Tax=Roseiflexus sp. TaxID=2562120 RepID=UPI0021DE265A|nr:acetyltransferase [Roseiflexus sp.]GIW00309.1 MAG: transferase [Roseiflexus sp.]